MYLYLQHEAGHFLVGYLLGVLPRGYEIPSKEALRQDRFAAGRVEFVGFEFLREVRTFLPFIMLLFKLKPIGLSIFLLCFIQ